MPLLHYWHLFFYRQSIIFHLGPEGNHKNLTMHQEHISREHCYKRIIFKCNIDFSQYHHMFAEICNWYLQVLIFDMPHIKMSMLMWWIASVCTDSVQPLGGINGSACVAIWWWSSRYESLFESELCVKLWCYFEYNNYLCVKECQEHYYRIILPKNFSVI